MNQNPLTDEQLNQIEARANAATQDPWLRTKTEDVRVLLAEVRRLRDEVDALGDDSALLAALQAAGVDNWEGYDDALTATP